MKILSTLLLSLLFLTSCSDPYSFNPKGERLPIPENKGKGGGLERTSDFFIFDNVDTTTDTAFVTFRTNADSSAVIVAYQGDINFNDEELELLDITTSVPTHDYSLFVWNNNMVNGVNYTDDGLKIAKFAYAGIEPVGVSGAAGLVHIKFRVVKNSTVCIKNFMYNETDVDKVFCAEVRKVGNQTYNI